MQSTKTDETRQDLVSPNGGGGMAVSREPALGPLVVETIRRPWWSSFFQEVSGLFQQRQPLPPPPKYRDPAPGEPTLGPLTIGSLNTVWFQNLVEAWRDYQTDRKRPPVKLTAKPVAVKSIWGVYDNRKRGLSWSAAAHVLFIVLVFGVFNQGEPPGPKLGSVTFVNPIDIGPYLAQLAQKSGESGGGGGGGQQSPLPPNRGRLPRFSMEQLTPPTPVIRNEDPELAVEPTVVVPELAQAPKVNMAIFGDPLGQVGPPSAGPGTGGGIGTGSGGGVGSGRGGGVGPGSGGGIGGGVFRVGGGVSAPRLVNKVEPEYSEEARKAKYQGTVVLAVEVWPDGQAHNIRVLRSLGLGLDEKAVQAVQQWKFVPGKKDGQDVKVAATIEVNFRLL